jgi:DNA-binding GntR family transcriptional regulator
VTSAPSTRSEWVEDRLRQAILRGELESGQRLSANELAQRWSISATPLREAFQRLAGGGLIEMLPQRGVRVSDLSVETAAQIYEIRILLEPLALRQSLERSDDDHRDKISATCASFLSAESQIEQIEAHAEFHRVLLERCPSPWLLRFVSQLADGSRLYQVASIGVGKERRHTESEHEGIRDSAISCDIEGCVNLQRQHLRRTLRLIAFGSGPIEEASE